MKRRGFLLSTIGTGVSLVAAKLGFAKSDEFAERNYKAGRPDMKSVNVFNDGVVTTYNFRTDKMDVLVPEGGTYQMNPDRKYGTITVDGGKLVSAHAAYFDCTICLKSGTIGFPTPMFPCGK
jgi:hypothetical protein